jgi:hypothetical protein
MMTSGNLYIQLYRIGLVYFVVQVSPVKMMPGTPGKGTGNGAEIRQDIVRFYKDTGLEPVAKEVIFMLIMCIMHPRELCEMHGCYRKLFSPQVSDS